MVDRLWTRIRAQPASRPAGLAGFKPPTYNHIYPGQDRPGHPWLCQDTCAGQDTRTGRAPIENAALTQFRRDRVARERNRSELAPSRAYAAGDRVESVLEAVLFVPAPEFAHVHEAVFFNRRWLCLAAKLSGKHSDWCSKPTSRVMFPEATTTACFMTDCEGRSQIDHIHRLEDRKAIIA